MKVIRAPMLPTGPHPFKYFEAWEPHPSFTETVHAAWNSSTEGNPMFLFIKKLANTKLALKRWNKEIFGPTQLHLAICKRALDAAQSALQQNPRDSTLMEAGKLARHNYSDSLTREEKFARQNHANCGWKQGTQTPSSFTI
ncbi:hypothetical protein QJS10_CPA09g01088 [Acorus calamus]|uniref:Uncharacterized protein n=1 Tax=Acorus calamus TaxID=4465 RepID=A0AAV9E641_ACOCL|nr:hypothetical protein QJS10_CPA09g01088 [Acorus calamus]